MKMMVVYEVDCDEGMLMFFPTVAQAMKWAQAQATDGNTARVFKTFIRTDLGKRALHAALLNRAGYCEGRDLIESFPKTGKTAASAAQNGE